ncbi:MAG: hypothetical protein IJP35_03710 [Clostridia bacterium]|nr:hypothetical protein [Clostridia bacterium]
MKFITILASEIAHLDSDVIRGGGTDDTAVLQQTLDLAKNGDVGVHLIMDGAALIRGLKVYSNTTIECLSAACGFYLADHSDCPVIQNGNLRKEGQAIVDHNITLLGGTYNQNCANQVHSIHYDDDRGFFPGWNIPGSAPSSDGVVNHQWVGVRRLTLRDVVIRDQRTYAMTLCNWEHVVIENIEIELPGRVHGQNQDGIHVFGPGRFLTIRNASGCTSDDFIALAPDERDGISTITDVVIDGVHLDDADQAIRMLCHKDGVLDRVTIRNISGTYRSFGFFINPFHPTGLSENAGYRNILIDGVDLRSNGVDYTYTPPFLFRVGGQVDNLTLKNITHYCPHDARPVVDVGLRYYMDNVPSPDGSITHVRNLTVDGLTVIRKEGSAAGDLIRLQDCKVEHLAVKNVTVLDDHKRGSLIALEQGATVKALRLSSVYADGLEQTVKTHGGSVEHLMEE